MKIQINQNNQDELTIEKLKYNDYLMLKSGLNNPRTVYIVTRVDIDHQDFECMGIHLGTNSVDRACFKSDKLKSLTRFNGSVTLSSK